MMKGVLSGKEVSPNSVPQVKSLVMELQQLVTFARASEDDSFLELQETVLAICRKRLAHGMKKEFSDKAKKQGLIGLKVNVDFLIEFLRDWYTDLNHEFGMSKLVESKSSSSSPSSFSSFPSRSSTSPSPDQSQARGKKPAAGVANHAASTKPAEASVAAVDTYAPRASFGGGYQRQWSSPRQQWSNGGRQWSNGGQQWSSPLSLIHISEPTRPY